MVLQNRISSAAIFVAIFLMLTSCRNASSEEKTVSNDDHTPLVVVVKPLNLRYSPRLAYSGTAFASREANLGSALPGRVERIHYQVGAHVAQGALIAELSDELLIQTKIEYETLKKDYERLQRLRDKGSVTEIQYDHVKAQYEASEARMRMIQSSTQIHAPFSGVIAERMMEEGEVFFINPGLKLGYSTRSGIVRLMQLDPMIIRLEVNERELAKIQRGMQASIAFDAHPDQQYKGRVKEIIPMLSTLSHTATVEIEFRNPGGKILPGMFANVSLEQKEQEGLSVPLQSIIKQLSDEKDYVFLVNADSLLVRREVKIEETRGDRAVVSGIPANSLVLIEGKGKAQPGEKVRFEHHDQRGKTSSAEK